MDVAILPKLRFRTQTGISRAYYAVLHLAKEYLEQVEGHSIPRTADAHRYVGNQFLVSADPRQQQIASQLVRLRRLRNQADYAARFPALASTATRSIKTAEDIIKALKSL